MNISNIVQRLSTFLQTKMNMILAPISTTMLICSTIKRPGISPMLITSRAINRFGEAGLPIGNNIDGSPNIMNQAWFIVVDELTKALKLDGKVEIGIPIGGITTTGFGANAGGMVSIVSTNTTPVAGSGIIR